MCFEIKDAEVRQFRSLTASLCLAQSLVIATRWRWKAKEEQDSDPFLRSFGAGRIGRIHAGNIARHPQARLAYVADADARAAESLAQQFSAQVIDLDAAVTARDVDAVLIASSTDTHADYIERCASAGKPVLCEKPLDLDVTRAERLRAGSAEGGHCARISASIAATTRRSCA